MKDVITEPSCKMAQKVFGGIKKKKKFLKLVKKTTQVQQTKVQTNVHEIL